MDNLHSQPLFIHHSRSVCKMPTYTIHKAPQVHKLPATTNSYHQIKMPPDQTEKIQLIPS